MELKTNTHRVENEVLGRTQGRTGASELEKRKNKVKVQHTREPFSGGICWFARGVKGQVGSSIPTGNNPPSMNGRRRVRGWGASGCSNLTASGTRGGVARDVTLVARATTRVESPGRASAHLA
ncbi:hypothetical protein DEO72_LG3g725 [Vigna unguiculata]|uniref:Uncharacterized protein n=1 Tax=Vigna unguiculata TaxID=3917 RepID=A0A4D6LD65_VIGUN|nr:hypothetical protein DEO72_LG3g725 [Vigna unguiculata]